MSNLKENLVNAHRRTAAKTTSNWLFRKTNRTRCYKKRKLSTFNKSPNWTSCQLYCIYKHSFKQTKTLCPNWSTAKIQIHL